MTWTEVLTLLEGGDYHGAKLGQERMSAVLERLGHPERKMRYLHIAGTNGKGSASALLQSILTNAGFRCGRYISPHLSRINERWSIDGQDISDEALRDYTARLAPVISSLPEHPTSFELLTLLGFLYFTDHHCDFTVLEVGMGGRLDATNVIPVSECSVIMKIGLDHTAVLGDSIKKIAREKGGILKEGGRCVLLHQSAEAEDEIREIAKQRHVLLSVTDPSLLRLEKKEKNGIPEGLILSYREHRKLFLSMPALYQAENALVVLDTVDMLRSRGVVIPEEAVEQGFASFYWPARFEVLCTTPLIILDGAHNPDGVCALMNCLRFWFPGQKFIFLTGVMADKNYHDMYKAASPLAASFFIEAPENSRALPVSVLKRELEQDFSGVVSAFPTVQEALEAAAAESARTGMPLICFGSLYQSADIRAALTNLRS